MLTAEDRARGYPVYFDSHTAENEVVKPRRIGFPSIAVYVLPDGSETPFPPTRKTHPDSASLQRDPIRPTPDCPYHVWIKLPQKATASLPYKLKILDRAAYDELASIGFWHGEAHCGPYVPEIDHRDAPLA